MASKQRRARRPPRHPKPLTPALELFVRHYDANGGNGVRAWLSSHPHSRSVVAAAQSAYQALKKPQVAAAVVALAEARYARVAMTGEEAAHLVAGDARADLRELYDEKGAILPVHLWPDSIARSVKAFRSLPDGGAAVTLNDSLAARRLILEQTGKLKSPLTPLTDLAALLAGKYQEGE